MSLFSLPVIEQAELLCTSISEITAPPTVWSHKQRLKYLKRQIQVLIDNSTIEDKKGLKHLEGLLDSLTSHVSETVQNNDQTETYEAAIKRGFNPRSYKFDPVPEGNWVGILDAKIWGKANRFTTLRCYFSTLQGEKYSISAFRARDQVKTKNWYTAQDAKLNLKDPSIKIGQTFLLNTGTNSKGNPVWKSIQPFH